jgi:hypothetical protein
MRLTSAKSLQNIPRPAPDPRAVKDEIYKWEFILERKD